MILYIRTCIHAYIHMPIHAYTFTTCFVRAYHCFTLNRANSHYTRTFSPAHPCSIRSCMHTVSLYTQPCKNLTQIIHAHSPPLIHAQHIHPCNSTVSLHTRPHKNQIQTRHAPSLSHANAQYIHAFTQHHYALNPTNTHTYTPSLSHGNAQYILCRPLL